ncbi:MAG TPA: prolyl oligopeptidase family serine peptidase, partial [Thermomicrobiaceae bacterium]|nr:prolyl oligopeptidase family serine peptidase [Thermomicrobiaceae bacterium]
MPEAFTVDDLVYGLKALGAPAISPDGERIVYAVSQSDPETKKTTSHLWIQSRQGGDARQLTFSGESNGSPVWSPDGEQIAFVSDRVKPDGQAGIFVMPACGLGEPREVSRHIHGISGLTWSADGKQLAYCALFDPDNPAEEKKGPDSLPEAQATTRFDYKGDGRGFVGEVRNQVWVVEVESGARRRLTSVPNDHADPAWSPDGKTIAAHVAREGNSWLVLIDVATTEQRRVGAPDSQVGNYSWSPSGDRLFYTADPGHTYQSDLYLYDVASSETKQLTEDFDIQPFTGMMGSGLAWLDARTVLFAGAKHAECGLYEIDVERGTVERLLSEPATRAGLSVDASGRYVAQLRMAFDQPFEVAVYDLKEGHGSIASRHNAGLLAEREPVGWERFSVEQGGLTTESWLLKPPGFDRSRRYPVIIDIHGGPNGFHASRFRPNDQLLATNGFIVVLPNPRGSTSFGRHFTMQVLGDRGGEDYKDLMAVADYVEQLPYVDPERIAIFG